MIRILHCNGYKKIYSWKGDISLKNYFKDFDLEDQKFMLEFLSHEGNIAKMTYDGYSYQKTRKTKKIK